MSSTSSKGKSSIRSDGAVVDLNAFRLKKTTAGDRFQGVQDTFRIDTKGRNTTNETRSRAGASDSDHQLAERIERLKSSIDRINKLMDELSSGPSKKPY